MVPFEMSMTLMIKNKAKTKIDSAKPLWRLTLFFGKKLETNTIIAMGSRILNPRVISNILRNIPKIAKPQSRKMTLTIIKNLRSNHSRNVLFLLFVLNKSICCGIMSLKNNLFLPTTNHKSMKVKNIR